MKLADLNGWVLFGLCGQAMFSARFFVQWLASEIRKQSVVPISFWLFSIAGSTALLIYAIARRDPVFIVGQSFGLLIYARNLILIRRRNRARAPG